MAEWTDIELRSTVRAYLTMLSAQERGQPYSKAEVRRKLRQGPLKARSEASIEYRMRNITAVLERHGRSTVKGYVAAANVGEAVSDKIWSMVREMDAAPPIAASVPKRKGSKRTAVTISEADQPPPMIYFNIGWMRHYAGPAEDDRTIGAHGYLGRHDHGAECYNFVPTKHGVVRGYRPPGDREQTNLNRMGAGPHQTVIDGALVVWLAREPGTGKTLIVGWYRNATVYRFAQDGGIDLNDERIHYSVEARAEDATLLPPAARTYVVPSSRVAPGQGFGQKPTWYGADAVNKSVFAYVNTWEAQRPAKARPTSRKPPKNYDPELRRKVERAAVDHAIAYYKAKFGSDCPVDSVEKEAKGWDLEVHCGPEPLLVEVKGLLNAGLVCELTPNEYEKMMLAANRSRYVVFVVNNALAEAPAMPIASVFEHAGGEAWRTANGRELIITEKVGAVLSCT